MQRGRTLKLSAKLNGFTLFELIVVICVIVILYMQVENRLSSLPATAERASFYGTLAQIKTGVNFAMLHAISGGNRRELLALEGSNPMDLLLEVPGNYGGIVTTMADSSLVRATWYFDSGKGELVYLVGTESVENVLVTMGSMQVPLGMIQFRINAVYSGPGAGRGSLQGLMLVPMRPYQWQGEIANEVETLVSR